MNGTVHNSSFGFSDDNTTISGNTSVIDILTSVFDDQELQDDVNDVSSDDVLARAKTVLFSIQYFLLPVFLCTGLFGNIFTIVTMMSHRFSHMTSRYILVFLAMSDTILLLTQPFNKIWIVRLFGRDFRAISDVSCKVFFVIFRSAKMTSSWLVVFLCFERFVAVVYPLRAKTILRKRFILTAIAIDYIFMFTYNSFWSFSSGVVGGICKPDLPSDQHMIYVTLGCTFYSFLPTALLLIFTPQIMVRLFYHQNFRQNSSASAALDRTTSSCSNRSGADLKRASVMVLGVMIAYIVLIIPITIVHLYAFLKGVSAFDVNTIGFFIYREIAQMLEQVNYAVNFFLYVLCSRVFRQRVLELLCWVRVWRNSRRSSSHTDSTVMKR